MTDCYFCNKPIVDNDVTDHAHTVCHNLRRERENNNMCTRCGDKTGNPKWLYCANCDNDSDWQNYPGPQ